MSTLVLILIYTAMVLASGYGIQGTWRLRGDFRHARAFSREVERHSCGGGEDCPVHAMDDVMAQRVRNVAVDLVVHVVLTVVSVVATAVVGEVLLASLV